MNQPGDFARHERELGALSKGQADLEADVNHIAEEARKTRHDTRNALTVMEGRLEEHVDARIASLEQRFDRMIATGRWVLGLSVPVICTLLGLLIGKS